MSKTAVSGKLRFKDDETPDMIPDGSVLVIKLEDTTKDDGPSELIARSQTTIQGWKKGDPCNYTLEVGYPLPERPELSISAVLNIGGKPWAEKWIQKGDFLNDRTHKVNKDDGILQDDVVTYNIDIDVINYK